MTRFHALAAMALSGISGLAMRATSLEELRKLEQVVRDRQYQKPNHTKTKSRYWPHQGKRECARRVEQMNRATLRAVNKRVAS